MFPSGRPSRATPGWAASRPPAQISRQTDSPIPITGGNVTVFDKDDVPRYVVGQVQHEGSGLSLSAGGKTVVVGNVNVDPTVSIVYGDVAVDGKAAAMSIPAS